jgi:hypothetical protein
VYRAGFFYQRQQSSRSKGWKPNNVARTACLLLIEKGCKG